MAWKTPERQLLLTPSILLIQHLKCPTLQECSLGSRLRPRYLLSFLRVIQETVNSEAPHHSFTRWIFKRQVGGIHIRTVKLKVEGRGPHREGRDQFQWVRIQEWEGAIPIPTLPSGVPFLSKPSLQAGAGGLLRLLMPGVWLSSDSSNGLQADRVPVSTPASPHPLHVSVPHNFSLVTLDLVRSHSVGYLRHRKSLCGHFIPLRLVQDPLPTYPLGKWTAGFCVNPWWSLQQCCRLGELHMPHRLQILLFSRFHRGDDETDTSTCVSSHHRTACRIQSCGKGSLCRLTHQNNKHDHTVSLDHLILMGSFL